MIEWAESRGDDRLWAVEDCRHSHAASSGTFSAPASAWSGATEDDGFHPKVLSHIREV